MDSNLGRTLEWWQRDRERLLESAQAATRLTESLGPNLATVAEDYRRLASGSVLATERFNEMAIGSTLAAEGFADVAGIGAASARAADTLERIAGMASGSTLAADYAQLAGIATAVGDVANDFRALISPGFDVRTLVEDYESFISPMHDARVLIKDYESFIRPDYDVRALMNDFEAFTGPTLTAPALQAADFIVVRTPNLVQDPVTELIAWIAERCRAIPGYMAGSKGKFVDLCMKSSYVLMRLLGRVPWDEAISAAHNVANAILQGDWASWP